MKQSKRILSVTVKRIPDDCPDTSWLGEYSNKAETEFSIDRHHALDCCSQFGQNQNGLDWLDRIENAIYRDIPQNRELQPHGNFYLAEEMATCETIRELRESLECDCGGIGYNSRECQYFNGPVENYEGATDAEIRSYILQDYERAERLNRGDWCFLGIRAEAEVQAETNGAIQTLTSGGLWGIESDSEKSYIEEEETNQLAELRGVLKAFGFSSRAISKAFQNIEHKDA